jgi:hypothetical protein
MDWLRRNWVDVLMGGLIVAIAAGVLVVLLRGGLFVSSNANPTVNPPAPTAPTNPVSVAPTPTPIPDTPAPTPTPQPPTTPTQAVVVKPKPTVTPRATANLSVPEIPEAPSSKPAATNTGGAAAGKPKNLPTQAVKPTQAIKPNINPSSNQSGAKPPSSFVAAKPTQQGLATNRPSTSNTGRYSRADFLRNYRVAAGSYANLERAIRAAAQLRARGLPAQHFSSGNTYVVVVGPYAREASARVALIKVRQSQPDAILYRPDGSKEGVALKKPSPATPQQGGGGSSPASLSVVAYLQVGAFKDSQSATVLLDKLKNAGFSPLTKNVAGLLRVLVGPLQSNQIETTRTTLKNQGFDAFPINL